MFVPILYYNRNSYRVLCIVYTHFALTIKDSVQIYKNLHYRYKFGCCSQMVGIILQIFKMLNFHVCLRVQNIHTFFANHSTRGCFKSFTLNLHVCTDLQSICTVLQMFQWESAKVFPLRYKLLAYQCKSLLPLGQDCLWTYVQTLLLILKL